MEEELVKEFLRTRTFAVVGASKNPEKYGHQIYKDLKGAGYRVYPVNVKRIATSLDPHQNDILVLLRSVCSPSSS